MSKKSTTNNKPKENKISIETLFLFFSISYNNPEIIFSDCDTETECCESCGLCFNCEILFKGLIIILILSIKIVCQIVEFYLLILLTNIIIEYKIIFICSLIDIKPFILFLFISIISFIFNFIFDYISINLLTIYYFEFLKFSWMNYDMLQINIIPSLIKKENTRKKKK